MSGEERGGNDRITDLFERGKIVLHALVNWIKEDSARVQSGWLEGAGKKGQKCPLKHAWGADDQKSQSVRMVR